MFLKDAIQPKRELIGLHVSTNDLQSMLSANIAEHPFPVLCSDLLLVGSSGGVAVGTTCRATPCCMHMSHESGDPAKNACADQQIPCDTLIPLTEGYREHFLMPFR